MALGRLRERSRSGLRATARALRTRRGQRWAFRIVAAAVLLALLPSAWLYVEEGQRLRTVADAPSEPVAVVFGAGLDQGVPSPYLAHRLDAALALYRAGKVQALLVTGDNGRTDYDEPDAMRTYLLQHGVPADRVVRDYAGFDTWDSCSRAHRIFGVDRALLVTQGFHVRRALSMCRAAGIDAYGIAVDEPHDATWYYGGVRELPAAGEAVLDAVLKPAPSLLGPKVTALARWR
ncbi:MULTISPECIES: vancomycin high temperature exclusion protein [Streptacidiphilus]|uniref:Vancomycin high temperature exclusion protein n=1 Tax=Streptacidiphilus cavernicola TaxID=3342716 RepID=A0ABV6UZ51_9ACTN|nr:ElyC/SanA/YdcF family protein [Streptacidiphilus jeojiense]